MLKLSVEQQVLLSLICEKDNSIERTSVDWEKVKTEALQQSVFGLISESPMLPDEIRTQWKMISLHEAASNIHSLYAVLETDRIMRECDFPYVILKGLSSAYYYPQYFQRSLGDCDFLINAGQKDAVMKALQDEGYEGNSYGSTYHVVFKKEDQDLEMHFDLPGMPKGKLGDLVREYAGDILTDTISFEMEGQNVVLPSAKNHGLILLLHMQHHMLSEGIGIRHLLDWCYFVARTQNESFWDAELLPLLKKIGMLKYATVMTKVGNIYFGTSCPEWAKDADEQLADEVMQDILDSGNFGKKDAARAGSSMLFTSRKDGGKSTKLGNLWRTLLVGVCGYHPELLGKYPVLYPLFIVQFVAVRFFRVLTGKRAPLYKSAKYVDERKSVYEKLGVFEV